MLQLVCLSRSIHIMKYITNLIVLSSPRGCGLWGGRKRVHLKHLSFANNNYLQILTSFYRLSCICPLRLLDYVSILGRDCQIQLDQSLSLLSLLLCYYVLCLVSVGSSAAYIAAQSRTFNLQKYGLANRILVMLGMLMNNQTESIIIKAVL